MGSSNPKEREEVARKIGSTFSILENKDQAWNDLLVLTKDQNSDVRWHAAVALGSAFKYLTDKEQASKDLLTFTKDQNSGVRKGAVEALGSAFQYLPDKEQASKDLLTFTKDQDSGVRKGAAEALGSAFQYLPDKEQASKDLLALTKDQDSGVRKGAAEVLGSAFQYLTDKEQASKDLLALLKDKNSYVQSVATNALGSTFQYLPDKNQTSKDLLVLTKDGHSSVRLSAAVVLVAVFQYLPDKDQAWKDLLALTKDRHNGVRWRAAVALNSAFQYLPDKEQASKDLLALTKDRSSDLRRGAAYTLGSAFQYLSDKGQASKDLLALTKDQDSYVRRRAAEALGSALQYLTNKEQASKGLLALTKDQDSYVRVSANHSLGKISVYRATNAEDEVLLQKELENAIGFFEKSAEELKWFNPSKFCLPFYRSYYTVIFRKQEAEEEVKKNLNVAKRAVSGSESKEKLLEAVENLSNALNETQKLRNLDDIKADLNGYRHYCDRACELLDSTEDTAPGATKLIKRGLPVIDERIREILAEIQEKAEAVCRQSLNTPFEDFGKEVNQISQDLPKVRDPITLEKQINIMLTALSPVCDKMSEIDNEACRYYHMAQREQYVEDKIPLINMILSKIPTHLGIGEKLEEIQILLEPKRKKELVFSLGGNLYGSGGQFVYTIPLDEIHYSGLEKDIKEIKDKNKFSNYPVKLIDKIKDYLVRNEKHDLLNRLK